MLSSSPRSFPPENCQPLFCKPIISRTWISFLIAFVLRVKCIKCGVMSVILLNDTRVLIYLFSELILQPIDDYCNFETKSIFTVLIIFQKPVPLAFLPLLWIILSKFVFKFVPSVTRRILFTALINNLNIRWIFRYLVIILYEPASS